MLRSYNSDSRPTRGGVDSETVAGNGASCFAYLVVVCLVMWAFTEPSVNFVRISHEICTQFTLSSHSQANKEDAGLDSFEWKKNGDNEAVVHQGSVNPVCGTLANIFFRIFGHIATL